MKDIVSSEKNKKIDNKRLERARRLCRDYLRLGTLDRVARKHNITKGRVSKILNEITAKGLLNYNNQKLRLQIAQNRIRRDYENMVKRISHHPACREMNKHKKWKNIYNRIIYRYSSLANFKRLYGYPSPYEKEIKEARTLRAKKIYNDYLSLGTLVKVAKRHGISSERVRQILKEGNSIGSFKYPPD